MEEAPKISVYMITFNNERTVERALQSVRWADEIVVVDSLSTDRTVEICQKFTDKFFQRRWPGHQEQYQYAADLTLHPWILFIDADEEVPPELADEIRNEVSKPAQEMDGFIGYRRTHYLGRWILHGGWNPDSEIRLYRRDKGRWSGGLHAKVVVDGKVGALKHPYLHYTYRDLSDQIQTIDRYSRIAAEDLLRSGERFSLFKMLFHPPFRLIKEYLLRSGFRDGVPGLIIVVATMFYVFTKYAKFWELIQERNKGDDIQGEEE